MTKKHKKLYKPHLSARTKNQQKFIDGLNTSEASILLAVGPAGTGKTLIAVTHAIDMFKSGHVERIIITRPAVSVDEEHGFLPGTLEKKMEPWVRPIYDVFLEHFPKHAVDAMIKSQTIEIAPLAYMRGRTFKNSYIIADEMQNTTPNQMKMILTRIGDRSRMVLTGDLGQSDLSRNGLFDFINRLDDTPHIELFRFSKEDVVRHKAVSAVLSMYGED